jgi:hypothetical protein
MSRIELFTPANRRIDLTPLSRRERAARAVATSFASIISLVLWLLIAAALWRQFSMH